MTKSLKKAFDAGSKLPDWNALAAAILEEWSLKKLGMVAPSLGGHPR